MIDEFDRYRYAQRLFATRHYAQAAQELEGILETARIAPPGHSLDDVEHLLARAYFHSAQLAKAETAARALIERDPTDGHAVLLLARSLERQGLHDAAEPYFDRADALGAIAASA